MDTADLDLNSDLDPDLRWMMPSCRDQNLIASQRTRSGPGGGERGTERRDLHPMGLDLDLDPQEDLPGDKRLMNPGFWRLMKVSNPDPDPDPWKGLKNA